MPTSLRYNGCGYPTINSSFIIQWSVGVAAPYKLPFERVTVGNGDLDIPQYHQVWTESTLPLSLLRKAQSLSLESKSPDAKPYSQQRLTVTSGI